MAFISLSGANTMHNGNRQKEVMKWTLKDINYAKKSLKRGAGRKFNEKQVSSVFKKLSFIHSSAVSYHV